MAPEPEVKDKDPEVIQQKIEETRSALTEKLETLESEVMGTVHNVTSTVENVTSTVEQTIGTVKDTVQETIGSVKDTVHETVQTVKQTFDLCYQVDRHPWGMMGLSVVGGFLTGALLQGARRGHYPHLHMPHFLGRSSGVQPLGLDSNSREPVSQGPSLLGQLAQQFEPELQKVKEMAIGAAVGLLRDAVKGMVPPNMTEQVREVFDSATTKLGGRPVEGPIVEPEHCTTGRANW